ncbi:MAG TPA: hypothetical protein VID50_07675 [Candidatus Eisenbacteria bacterium]
MTGRAARARAGLARRFRRLLLPALLLLLSGCTTRERLNPLDPHNNRTGGTVPGFEALAGDSVVELRWVPLAQAGVRGYRVQRWKPGEPSRLLGSAEYGPSAVAAEDRTVKNDSTYVYRLVAHLLTGDSAVSLPDTATPGARRILALAADVVSLAGLTPDLRDFLFTIEAGGSFQDMELDRKSGVLWVITDDITGGVLRRFALNGTALDQGAVLSRPTDLSVAGNRGMAWVALPDEGAAAAFAGAAPAPLEVNRIPVLGSPRVLEAGSLDPSVWVGTQEGSVVRANPNAPSDRVIVGRWELGAPIGPIALDEADGAAWVIAKRDPRFHDLYRITEADSTARLVRSGLDNVVDLAVNPASGDLWVSERGVPRSGSGALVRLNRMGEEKLRIGSLEPYGLDVDLKDGSCWMAELRSNRILRVQSSGALLAASRTLSIPFEVRVHAP